MVPGTRRGENVDLNPIIQEDSTESTTGISSGWMALTPEEEWGPFNWVTTEEEFIEFINNEYAVQREFYKNPRDYEGVSFQAKYLQDSLGRPMLVPGQIHIIYGASESKKSFLGLTAVLDNHGFYIDLEMGGPGLSTRIGKMNYEYSCSDGFAIYPTKDELLVLVAELCDRPATVVVIDSFAQLSVLLDKDTNSGGDTGLIFQMVLRPLATAGHAVVVIDHSPKAKNSNDHPIGSQNKKAQADIMYRVQINDGTGQSELFIEKDRYHVIRGRLNDGQDLYGEVRLTDNPLRLKIVPADYLEQSRTIVGVRHNIYRIMERIMLAVIKSKRLTKSEIDTQVQGKSGEITKARNELVSQGFLVEVIEKEKGVKPKTFLALSEKKWRFTTLDLD